MLIKFTKIIYLMLRNILTIKKNKSNDEHYYLYKFSLNYFSYNYIFAAHKSDISWCKICQKNKLLNVNTSGFKIIVIKNESITIPNEMSNFYVENTCNLLKYIHIIFFRRNISGFMKCKLHWTYIYWFEAQCLQRINK